MSLIIHGMITTTSNKNDTAAHSIVKFGLTKDAYVK